MLTSFDVITTRCSAYLEIVGWRSVCQIALFGWALAGCGHHVYHRVEPGDTLYSIGWRYDEDYRDVAAWNGITSPYRIRAGQVLRLIPPPDFVSRSPSQKKSNVTRANTFHDRTTRITMPKVWLWPTDGVAHVLRHQAGGAARGLEIVGDVGQAIRAVAAGRVVYTGNNLKGYGNLVIVKHGDEFLSAYAHNSKIVVVEGDEVTAGQKVAEMGRNNNNRTALYFEIRRNGKAEDPLQYLPVRR